MKVYVLTEAKLFQPERYIGVKKSIKEAEKALRSIAPHMRPTDSVQKGIKAYFTDSSNKMFLFIHEEEI